MPLVLGELMFGFRYGSKFKENIDDLNRYHLGAVSITYPYTLKGDVLEIRYPEGFILQYRRLSGDARTAYAEQDRQLSRLLVGSAWCSFSYSGGSLYSRTSSSRIPFFPNGTYRYSSRSEGNFAGRTGDGYNRPDGSFYSSQNDAASDGRWEVRYGRLYISEGSGPLEEVGLKVTSNSNGYPILMSEGKEYNQCK